MTTLHGKEINIGNKVWDYISGWDEVMAFVPESIMPIRTNYAVYDIDGRDTIYKVQSLFWQEFKAPAHAFEKPKVKKYLVVYFSEYFKKYYTSQNNTKEYFTDKQEFDMYHKDEDWKFVSLIIESEIEVEE